MKTYKLIIILFCFIIIYILQLDYKRNKIKKFNFIHIPKNGGSSIKLLDNKLIIYHHHGTNVFCKKLKNQLVILRDPIDRFKSSVRYAIQKWSHLDVIKTLIKKKIDTPERWVNIMSNKNDPLNKILNLEILNNKSHKIGNKYPKYKFTYTSQNKWINNPEYVILFENLDEEFKEFCRFNNIKVDLIKVNSTKKNDTEDNLSIKSIKYLKKKYRKDIKLYEKYKNIPITKRLLY